MSHAKYGRSLYVATALWLGAWGVSSAQQPTPAQNPGSAPPRPSAVPLRAPAKSSGTAANPERIAAWVNQLEANEFLVRETAMVQLLEAGPAVLPALKPVLATGDLESTSRALFIVRQIGLTADLETKDSAGELLAELATRKETPALARRAAVAWGELVQQRSAQALAELEEMGAKVTHNMGFGGLILDDGLGSLEIGDAFRGQENDLRRLKWLANVPVLVLNGKKVTDDWLKHAASLPGLEELHVYQAPIDDAALAALTEHPTLKLLGIYYTPVSDQSLASLVRIPSLGYLKLYGTKITSEELEKFREASGLGIDYKRGAFLGVGGIEVEGGCLISTVHEGSPAEKGGLLREDLIVSFGGEPVANFSSLMGLIAKRDINEEVEIEVKRRTVDDQGNPAQKTIATKVKLVPWDAELAVRNPRR